MPVLTTMMRDMPRLIIGIGLVVCTACANQADVKQTAITVFEDAQLTAILDRLDQLDLPLEVRLADYTENAVILVPGEMEIRGHAAIRTHLAGFSDANAITTEHQIIELNRAGYVIIVQGGVTGTATPKNGPATRFATKNLILLKADNQDQLKIWKVIYNSAPIPESQFDSEPVTPAPTAESGNPFAAFFGVWTLQADRFQQVWDGKTLETLTLPNHLTHCGAVNTSQTLLCNVTADGLTGHILWGREAGSRRVAHLSHFGDVRLGTGNGTQTAEGDLELRISFSDEPAGTYRIYRYTWIDADSYKMLSTQYDASDTATGNWYGGTFVRVPDRP